MVGFNGPNFNFRSSPRIAITANCQRSSYRKKLPQPTTGCVPVLTNGHRRKANLIDRPPNFVASEEENHIQRCKAIHASTTAAAAMIESISIEPFSLRFQKNFIQPSREIGYFDVNSFLPFGSVQYCLTNIVNCGRPGKLHGKPNPSSPRRAS